MVAYKNNPGQNKDYHKQNYRLPAFITSKQYIPSTNEGLDRIVRSGPNNELYQKRIEPSYLTREYYLSQPTWFYEIMKKLAADEAGKKKTASSQQPEYSLN
jgi:hypothetical protein